MRLRGLVALPLLTLLHGCGPSLRDAVTSFSVGGIPAEGPNPRRDPFDPYYERFNRDRGDAPRPRHSWGPGWLAETARPYGEIEDIEWYGDGGRVVAVVVKPRWPGRLGDAAAQAGWLGVRIGEL